MGASLRGRAIFAFLLFCGLNAMAQTPPVADRHPHVFILNGDTRVDFYEWMRNETQALP